MKNFTYHLKHYTPLVGILLAGFFGFYIFSFDRIFQAAMALAAAAGYVSWGVIHHYIHKDLYAEVVIEYIAVAFLGLVILFSVIFRS